MFAPDREAAPHFFFMFRGDCVSPHSHLPSLTPPSAPLFLAFDSSSCFLPLTLQTRWLMVSFSVSLFSYSGHCHSVLIHCYALTAHQGPGDPHGSPAPLSSRAKNSTAFSCLLYWTIPQAPQTQHVPSALIIHVHPSSCHHCHPPPPLPQTDSFFKLHWWANHLPTFPASHTQVTLCDFISPGQSGMLFCQLCFPFSVGSPSSSPPTTTVLVWVLFLSHLH